MSKQSDSTRIANLREDYRMASLNEADVHQDPLVQFEQWFEQALSAELPEANAMALATVTPAGKPACRVVLLKGIEHGGFTFYTNYDSAKGQEMAANDQVALTFLWYPIERQVRIEGTVEKVSAEESDAYFAIRPLGSQLGAWASPQSEVIERPALEQRLADIQAKYPQDPPRPPHWGGYRVRPEMIEFWQGRRSRLHDRIRYRQTASPGETTPAWTIDRLGP